VAHGPWWDRRLHAERADTPRLALPLAAAMFVLVADTSLMNVSEVGVFA
jgi:hypothetical protein